MNFFLIFLFLLINFQLGAIEKEAQVKLTDYFKILNQSPLVSAVPEAIYTEILALENAEEKQFAAQGLRREAIIRSAKLIALCRKEAREIIKEIASQKGEFIKEKLAALRAIGEIKEQNLEVFNKNCSELEGVFLTPVNWSNEVLQNKKNLEDLLNTLNKLESENQTMDFSAIEYIAKISLYPPLLNDKNTLTNLNSLSVFPLEVSLAAMQINLMRVFAGKNTLLIDPRLNLLAVNHCKDMKANNFMGGESPTPGVKNLKERAVKAGTTAEGEIFGRGTTDILKINRAYFGRIKNVQLYFQDWQRLGIGYHDKYWTEVFGK